MHMTLDQELIWAAWYFPTLSCPTIGSIVLNCWVRKGTRCFHDDMGTTQKMASLKTKYNNLNSKLLGLNKSSND